MTAVFLALGAGAVVRYVFPDTGTLDAQLAASRKQAAAATAKALAARHQAAAAKAQVVVARHAVAALQSQGVFAVASDLLDRLDIMRNEVEQAAHKSDAKPCLGAIDAWLAQARKPADRLFTDGRWTRATADYRSLIGRFEVSLQRCDLPLSQKITIRHAP